MLIIVVVIVIVIIIFIIILLILHGLFLLFQGMGYLCAKNIVHKDLKSKNIFLESGKVVITAFGLFNVTKLCHGSRYVYIAHTFPCAHSNYSSHNPNLFHELWTKPTA